MRDLHDVLWQRMNMKPGNAIESHSALLSDDAMSGKWHTGWWWCCKGRCGGHSGPHCVPIPSQSTKPSKFGMRRPKALLVQIQFWSVLSQRIKAPTTCQQRDSADICAASTPCQAVTKMVPPAAPWPSKCTEDGQNTGCNGRPTGSGPSPRPCRRPGPWRRRSTAPR